MLDRNDLVAAMTTPAVCCAGGAELVTHAVDAGGVLFAGFLVATADGSGGFHKNMTWSLSNTAADGLYGVVLTLGPEAGTTGFTTSDPFLIGFVNGSVADVPLGFAAMVNVALVPEPSSMALAALGVAGVLAAGYRRRRRAAGPKSTATEIAG